MSLVLTFFYYLSVITPFGMIFDEEKTQENNKLKI